MSIAAAQARPELPARPSPPAPPAPAAIPAEPASRNDALGVMLARAIAQRGAPQAPRAGAAAGPLLQRGFWDWLTGRRAPAPAPAPRPAAPRPVAAPRVAYPGSNILISPAADYNAPDGRDFVTTVTAHLDDIRAIFGAGFFTELAANGKRQVIKHGGNQCAGTKDGYMLLRRYHDESDDAAFGTELTRTIGDMGIDAVDLMEALRAQPLGRWSGTTDAAPIPAFSEPDLTLEKVTSWLAGRSRPSIDEMDVLMLVVAAAARPGVGVSSLVSYNPLSLSTSQGPRPPQAALAHELVHGMYNAGGLQLGREDSSEESAGGRLFELMSVGLRPFHTERYSENALRRAWIPAVPPRPSYGQ